MSIENSEIPNGKLTPEQISRGNKSLQGPWLRSKTRDFIQQAFANNASEDLSEKEKWVLARYVVDDDISFADLRRYAGVKYPNQVRLIYYRALEVLWNASPVYLKNKFPQEILAAKSKGRPGREFSVEHKAKIAALANSEAMAKARIKAGLAAKTPEVREKIGASQRERWRRIKEKRGKP